MGKGSAEAIAALTGFVKNLYDMIQGGDNDAIEVRVAIMPQLRKFFGCVWENAKCRNPTRVEGMCWPQIFIGWQQLSV